FAGILPGLLAHKFDMVSATIAMTQERAEKFAFTVPIGVSAPGLLKRKGDSRIKTLDDLSGKVVGVTLNTAPEQDMKAFDQQLKKRGLAGLKEIKEFTGNPEAFIALENGSVDGVFDSNATLAQVMSKRPGVFEIVPGYVSKPRWESWVMRPEDTDLLD